MPSDTLITTHFVLNMKFLAGLVVQHVQRAPRVEHFLVMSIKQIVWGLYHVLKKVEESPSPSHGS